MATQTQTHAERAKMSVISTKGKGETAPSLIIWSEHDRIREAVQNVFNAPDTDKKSAAFRDLLHLVAQHEVAEDTVIHPIYRHLTHNEERAQEALDQEASFSSFLANLQKQFEHNNQQLSDEMEKELQHEVVHNLNRHFAFEERAILPVIERQLDEDDTAALNEYYEKLKRRAPDNPRDHPEEVADSLRTADLEAGKIKEFVDKFKFTK